MYDDPMMAIIRYRTDAESAEENIARRRAASGRREETVGSRAVRPLGRLRPEVRVALLRIARSE